MIETIDQTIATLEGVTTMDEQGLYAGFGAEEQERHEAYIAERYTDGAERIANGKRVRDASGRKLHKALMAELADIEAELKALHEAVVEPGDAQLAPAIARHRAWVGKVWDSEPSVDAYNGLGELYRSHPEFAARFERLSPGMAGWLCEAMRHHASSSAANA